MSNSQSPLLSPGKPLALLVYLHALADRRASREHLTSLLWADAEPFPARHGLRQTIWFLRQRLGPNAIASSHDEVVLTLAVDSDRQRFLEAVESGRLDDGMTEYRGEFLPDFAVAGGIAFEHWADAERQRLRLLFARAAESLARDALKHGHFRRARHFARRVRDTDPLDERGWRLLIETCLAHGDRVSALTEGQHLEDLLAQEHRPPEPVTQALLRRVLARPSATDQADEKQLVAELVGRETEFATLVSAFERARNGMVSTALIVARAGLGKTRLLRDVGRRLHASGASWVYVRAHAADRDVPWAYVADIVRELAERPGALGVAPAAAASLIALDPALSSQFNAPPDPAVGEEASRRRLAALAELVRAVSDERPLALLLDDLHWSDAVSRDALERLPGRLKSARALLALAARPNGTPKRLEADCVVSLQALTNEQVAVLLASLGSLPSEPWTAEFATRLRSACDASPLLILETLHFALETGCLTLQDGGWTCHDEQRLNGLLQEGGALTRRIEQLDRSQGWLLRLLAVAAGPLPVAVATRAYGQDADRTLADLTALEKRGLSAKIGNEWVVGHDEIAARAIDLTTTGQQRAAHAALGRALAAETTDPDMMRAAARHFADADAEDELAMVATRSVRRSRAAGDRRRANQLVADLLGSEGDTGRIRRIVMRLPWTVRFAWARAAGAVAVALIMAVSVIAVVNHGASDGIGVTVGAWLPDPSGGWRLHTHRLSPVDLQAGAIDVSTFHRTDLVSPANADGAVRPGAIRTLATNQPYPDSGGNEVTIIRVGEASRRLTFRKGDDMARAWAPDGSLLAIATDRWTDLSRTDIAILDPDRPVSVVRLTSSEQDRDDGPVWSPDGTRIAFTRKSPGTPRTRQCVVSVDGTHEMCLKVPGYSAGGVAGWAGPLEVAGSFRDSSGTNRILIVNTESGKFREVAEGFATGRSHAPGWIICFCRRSGAEPFQAMVLSLAPSGEAVRIEPGDVPPNLTLFRFKQAGAYLEHIRIEGTERPIPVDGQYRLSLRGWDAQGTPVDPVSAEWLTSDTTVATVDTSGNVHPRRQGRLSVIATAGGWRSDTAEVTIGPAGWETLVVEDWQNGVEPAWVPFGEPRPFVFKGDSGPALAPNGDGTYASGVYLRQRLPADRGIGVEIEVSTPRTQLQWQSLKVQLLSADSLATEAWDLDRGRLEIPDSMWRECRAEYPAGENESGWNLIIFASAIAQLLPAPPGMREGRWTRIRIQFFPDGRCGLAVDGYAVTILNRRVPMGNSAMLMIGGKSHRTRFLVGRVDVWTGVRRDVDWEVLQGK